MKAIITVLLSFLCYFSNAQQADSLFIRQQIANNTLISLAGNDLKSGSVFHFVGISTMVGGGLLMGTAYFMDKKGQPSAQTIGAVGATVFLAGFIVDIGSFVEVRRAGKRLEKIR